MSRQQRRIVVSDDEDDDDDGYVDDDGQDDGDYDDNEEEDGEIFEDDQDEDDPHDTAIDEQQDIDVNDAGDDNNDHAPTLSAVSGDDKSISVDLRGPLRCAWARGDAIALYDKSDAVAYEWNISFNETIALLHSWHAVFQSTHLTHRTIEQRSAASPSTREWSAFILSQCRLYRAELESTLIAAAKSLDSNILSQQLADIHHTTVEFHSHLLLLENAKNILHLFEIFYIDDSANITAQLTDWLQRTVPTPQPINTDNNNNIDVSLLPESPEYIQCLLRCIMHGRIDDALQLLFQSPSLTSMGETYTSLVSLLSTVPSLTHRNETSLQSFITVWSSWQRQVTTAAQSYPVNQSATLHAVYSLLSGDTTLMLQCADSWIELLVAYLLYVKPHAEREQIPVITQSLVKQWTQQRDEENDQQSSTDHVSALSDLDKCRTAIIYGQTHIALTLTQRILDMPWLTAHIAHLLHLVKALDDPLILSADGLTVAEYYLLNYAQSIITHTSLHTCALTYLDACPVSGKQHMAAYLTLQQPQVALAGSAARISSLTTLKLIAAADRYKLPPNQSATICFAMADSYLRQRQYGTAVFYYRLSRESHGRARIDSVIQLLLKKYFTESDSAAFQSLNDVNDNLATEQSQSSHAITTLKALIAWREAYDTVMSSSDLAQLQHASESSLIALTVSLLPILSPAYYPALFIDLCKALQRMTLSCSMSDALEMMRLWTNATVSMTPPMSHINTIDKDKMSEVRRTLIKLTSQAARVKPTRRTPA